MTLREEIEAINYTYMSKADEETLTGAYERLAGVLSDPALNAGNRMDGEALLYRLYGKIELTKYFRRPTAERADDLAPRLEAYIRAARDKNYPSTAAVLEAALALCRKAAEWVRGTDEYRRKLSDPDLGYALCEAAMSKISEERAVIAAEDIKNPFRVGEFIDAKAELLAFTDGVYGRFAAAAAEKRSEKLGGAIKDITSLYSMYEYFPAPEYDEGGKANALVVVSPLSDDVKLFAVNAKREDKPLILLSAELITESDVPFAVEHLKAADADFLVTGLCRLSEEARDSIIDAAIEAGKEKKKVFISDEDGGAPIYDRALVRAAAIGRSVTDVSAEYLTVPPFKDVVSELERRGMLERANAGILQSMPFMGYMGLNRAITAKISGRDWVEAGKRVSGRNEAAAKKYLLRLKAAYMFIDGGWGDFESGIAERDERGEFDYDGVKEVDLANVRKIVVFDGPIFAKCGMIVRYCTIAGDDYSVWEGRSHEEKEERLTLATELVFRLLGVAVKPKVSLLSSLDNPTAGGLCIDGGKEIQFLERCCMSWTYSMDVVVHESFHALQAYLTSGGWTKWYFDNLGITKGRVSQWKETRQIYNDNTNSKVYKVHMYEADARAFEEDCAAGRDYYWNKIDFTFD